MRPKFSLIMTVFDTFHFLPRALAGVVAQDYAEWELLLFVDGPAPRGEFEPRRLLQQLQRRHSSHRWEWWELPRAEGCYGNVARNLGLSHATGDYVCWINHDNLIFPNYLTAHAENIRKTPGCVSVVDIDYWRQGRCHGRYPRSLARSRIDLLNFAAPLETARAVNAFGGEASRVYAADWLTFDACRRRGPVEHARVMTGVHF